MSGLQQKIRVVTAWVLQRKLVRAALLFSDQNGAMLAAAITFRLLFSVFSGVLLGFSVLAVWFAARPDLIEAIAESMETAIPGIGDIVNPESIEPASFTVAGIIALLTLLWSTLSAVSNTRTALQQIAGTAYRAKGFVSQTLGDLAFALSIALLLLATTALTMVGVAFTDTVLEWIGLEDSSWAGGAAWVVTVLSIFVLDAVVVAWLFRLLSGYKAHKKQLWQGAILGGIGLTVLQQLSGLFVGGATSNPLLVGFGSLIALLLWFNLSAQVILVASAFIVIAGNERSDRAHEKFGAETFAQQKVRAAERNVQVASAALAIARENEAAERQKLATSGQERELAAEAERIAGEDLEQVDNGNTRR